jgi:hypothetical protein
MKKRLPPLCGTSIFLSILLIVLPVLSCGCGESQGPYYQPGPKARPYPSGQVQQARDMVDQGYELYRQALNSTDQDERNALIDNALNNYYFPAQEKLERLKAEYPEHVSDIDKFHQVLSQKIVSAQRTKGIGN